MSAAMERRPEIRFPYPEQWSYLASIEKIEPAARVRPGILPRDPILGLPKTRTRLVAHRTLYSRFPAPLMHRNLYAVVPARSTRRLLPPLRRAMIQSDKNRLYQGQLNRH
jgi:hypothetical protein